MRTLTFCPLLYSLVRQLSCKPGLFGKFPLQIRITLTTTRRNEQWETRKRIFRLAC